VDIDIDLQTSVDTQELFPRAIRASMNERGELKTHLVGNYFQHIPVDKETGLAAITYKKALEYGFFKIDLIHLKLLDRFESKDQLEKYMFREPKWEMFTDSTVVSKLFHLYKSYDLLAKVKPCSVLEVADCLALIRPGKVRLINSYIKDKKAIRQELYRKEQASDLRKSHAIPYAYLVIANINLIEDGLYETL